MRRLVVHFALGTAILISSGTAHAQFGRGGGDWGGSGGDAQRSGWVRTDAKISPEHIAAPGFSNTWKLKFPNEAKQLNGLTVGSHITRYIGIKGFRTFAFIGGSGENVYAIDTDLGRVDWSKHLTGAAKGASTAACPGGMTASVVRPVGAPIAAAPMAGRGGGGGRGSAAKSTVSEPNKGSTILTELEARNAAAAANPAAGRGGGGGGGGRGGANLPRERRWISAHAITSDGAFHTMWVSNGNEPNPAIPFVPAGSNVAGLMLVDTIAYAATTGGCGGAPEAIWALDITNKQVVSWKVPSGGLAGDGPAIGPDGTVYVTTQSGELVALDGATLKMKDAYKAGQAFATSPVIFQNKDKVMAAAATKDGAIHVVDVAAMSGAVAKSAGGTAVSGSLASWQDGSGARWILAPLTSGKVVAMKLADGSLTAGWSSREIPAPLTPIVVNGVVFAVASGEFQSTDAKVTAAQRAAKSTGAVLYALDGASGKELWNSGKTITSFLHNGGISSNDSQVYLGTYDGTVYAFGFPIEH